MKNRKSLSIVTVLFFIIYTVMISCTGVIAIIDTTPPTVLASTPVSGAAGVPTNTAFVVKFSEPIQKGIAESWDIIAVYQNFQTRVSATLAISGSELTITPVAGVWDDSRGYLYKVQIPQNSIQDLAGNGLAHTAELTFSTVDRQPPRFISSIPANRAVNVGTDQPLIITFDEPIGIDTTGDLGFNYTVSNPVKSSTSSIQWQINENRLYLYSSAGWDDGWELTYTITIVGGTIHDLDDNTRKITGDLVFTFTTKDLRLPTVKSVTPAGNSLNVLQTTPIILTFSRPVVPGSTFSSIQVLNASGTPLSIAKSWTNSSTLKITATAGSWPHTAKLAIKLPAGAVKGSNNLANPAWSSEFTTVDKTAPVKTAHYPAVGATSVDDLKRASLTFSENILAGPNYGLIKATCNGSAITLIKMISGKTVSFFYGSRWLYGKSYVISVPAGSFKDAAGNINNTVYTLRFTIKQKPVTLAFSGIMPLNVRVKGSTATFNYSIDKTCNVKIDIVDAAGTIKRTISKTGVTAGSRTIAWDGNQTGGTDLPYGSYSVRLTATPADPRYASASIASRALKIVAQANVSIAAGEYEWNYDYDIFIAAVSINTTGKLYVSIYSSTGALVYSETCTTEPTAEGANTVGYYGWLGYKSNGSFVAHGTYKVTFKLANSASSDSQTISLVMN